MDRTVVRLTVRNCIREVTVRPAFAQLCEAVKCGMRRPPRGYRARCMSALRPHSFRVAFAIACVLVIALTLSGCKLGDNGLQETSLSSGSSVDDFARGTGSPALTTGNTIRIPGADPASIAAAAA